ncbi:MAG: hypothetical protein QF921_03230 [Pseudomonadales bacterium]|nr:hypothetical protein [Acidiferrobacteraceae bacterium]MDP6375444.1 hypothetical protein [Pseudomonadales bacterium]MDP6470651.1 hypothetical protein [Pseudomonadales bacterium]MDP6828493.1 hypothetical protein [Pseudomonadales bacterium]MDP6970522.1 hypothetical protein [Pseudomonadales bacterium]
MSKQKNRIPAQSTHEMRKTLAADVRAYLDSGKEIEQVPSGVSGQDPLGSQRHIVLGNKKKA